MTGQQLEWVAYIVSAVLAGAALAFAILGAAAVLFAVVPRRISPDQYTPRKQLIATGASFLAFAALCFIGSHYTRGWWS